MGTRFLPCLFEGYGVVSARADGTSVTYEHVQNGKSVILLLSIELIIFALDLSTNTWKNLKSSRYATCVCSRKLPVSKAFTN